MCDYNAICVRPKLHYMDTGYGHVVQHHQRTPPKDELTTILQQICHIAIAGAQHLDMSRCWDVANFCPLVVNSLYKSCRIVVSSSVGGVRIAGVRVVEFGS